MTNLKKLICAVIISAAIAGTILYLVSTPAKPTLEVNSVDINSVK